MSQPPPTNTKRIFCHPLLSFHPKIPTPATHFDFPSTKRKGNMPMDQNLVAFAQDGQDTIYGVTESGSVSTFKSFQFGHGEKTTSSIELRNQQPWSVIHPNPLPEFFVSEICVSFSGSFGIIRGCDVDKNCLGLLDFWGAYPCRDEETDQLARECAFVSWTEFRSSRGIPEVQSVKWFPYSDTHFGVLTSNNRFLIYSAHDLSNPEQDFALWVGSEGTSWGVDGSEVCMTDFTFGVQDLWGRFSVYFLCNNGGIYVLCPVYPAHCIVPDNLKVELEKSCENEGLGPQVLSFIDSLPTVSSDNNEAVKRKPERSERVTLREIQSEDGSLQRTTENNSDTDEHNADYSNDDGTDDDDDDSEDSDEDWDSIQCPVLQGPLNHQEDSCWELDMDYYDEALSISCMGAPDSVTLISTASSSGQLFTHILTDEIHPQFSDSKPILNQRICQTCSSGCVLPLLHTAVLSSNRFDSIQIIRDPRDCALCVCMANRLAYQIRMPWLSQLEHIAGGRFNEENGGKSDFECEIGMVPGVDDTHTCIGCLWFNGGCFIAASQRGSDRMTMIPFGHCEHDDEGGSLNEEAGRKLDREPDVTSSDLDVCVSDSALEQFSELIEHFGECRGPLEDGLKQVKSYGEYLGQQKNVLHNLLTAFEARTHNAESVLEVYENWPNSGALRLLQDLDFTDFVVLKMKLDALMKRVDVLAMDNGDGENDCNGVSEFEWVAFGAEIDENEGLVKGMQEELRALLQSVGDGNL